MGARTMTKKAQAEQERRDAIAKLRELFPVGSEVPTVLRHVSQSGMSRTISVLAVRDGAVSDVSHLVAQATGRKLDPRHPGVRMGGCGMDMGFALAYSLARTLYADGFPCTGVDHGPGRCPSNDHVNDWQRPHVAGELHSDPGYALTHRHV